MNPVALPKKIYTRAKELGVETIELRFQGGNDEGYLDVSLDGKIANVDADNVDLLDQAIQEWAWSEYSYSGAGDGNDFGDNITYDLVKNTMTSEEWHMERVNGENVQMPLNTEETPE
jgi:hypothetical protein